MKRTHTDPHKYEDADWYFLCYLLNLHVSILLYLILRASHTLWGDSLKEYVCVDSSGDMNTLAEQLLSGKSIQWNLWAQCYTNRSTGKNVNLYQTGGNDVDNPVIKQVYFRQFLPVSPKVSSAALLNFYLPKLYTGFTKLNTTKVFFFFLSFPQVQFDLVIAAFSLSELATLDERLNVIFTLWRKTNSYLVSDDAWFIND